VAEIRAGGALAAGRNIWRRHGLPLLLVLALLLALLVIEAPEPVLALLDLHISLADSGPEGTMDADTGAGMVTQ